MKDFLSIISGQDLQMTFADAIVSMSIAFLNGLIISKIYLKTYSGFSFDKTFSFTLIILTIIISLVMMVISTNIALSLGLIGSLSIIRFRTVVKDSRDMAFLFWSIAIGLTVGAKYLTISIYVNLFIALVVLIITRLNINQITNTEYIFVINHKSNNELITKKINLILDKYNIKYEIKSSYLDSKDLNNELTYNIILKDKKIDIVEIQKNINKINSINNISILGPESNIYA